MSLLIHLTIAICLMGFTSNIFSQCESAGSLPAVTNPSTQQTKQDIQKIFSFILPPSKDLQQPTAKVVGVDSAKDLLIVPSERVGSFKLKSPLKSVSSIVASHQGVEMRDETYEKILPMAYIPKRFFIRTKTNDMRFAFSVDRKSLKEIKVENPIYKTIQNIGVGSIQALVQKHFPSCETREEQADQHYICEGITFTFSKKKVKFITVF